MSGKEGRFEDVEKDREQKAPPVYFDALSLLKGDRQEKVADSKAAGAGTQEMQPELEALRQQREQHKEISAMYAAAARTPEVLKQHAEELGKKPLAEQLAEAEKLVAHLDNLTKFTELYKKVHGLA